MTVSVPAISGFHHRQKKISFIYIYKDEYTRQHSNHNKELITYNNKWWYIRREDKWGNAWQIQSQDFCFQSQGVKGTTLSQLS